MLLRPRVRPPALLPLPLLQLEGLLLLLTKAAEAKKGATSPAARTVVAVVAKRRPCLSAKVICMPGLRMVWVCADVDSVLVERVNGYGGMYDRDRSTDSIRPNWISRSYIGWLGL